MNGASNEIRIATPDDAAALRDAFGDATPFRRLFEADPQVVIVIALRAGDLVGALVVETSGHPVNADWAWASARFASASAGAAEVLPGMYEAAAAALAGDAPPGSSATALAVPVEVGDRATGRLLENAGFKPAGGAYRAIGPGMVEYLDGYADPQGFVVDFVRELG